MKKTLRLFSFVIGLTMTFAVKAQVAAVRFAVELPGKGIQKDSAVFLAGSFNNWNPKDGNYKMTRTDNRHYTLLVPCFAGKNYEYKYTLGGWGSVEKKADNTDIDNRKFTARDKQKISDIVVTWSPQKAAAPKDTTHALSKAQMGKLMLLKDSVTKGLAPIVPRLMELLQNVNTNLLADKPDAELSKQYTAQAIEIIGQVLGSLSNTMRQMVDILTPEQKQKIRDAMKNSKDPKDIVTLISNTLMPGSGDK